MTIYFAGTEADAISVNSAIVSVSTGYDSLYSRASLIRADTVIVYGTSASLVGDASATGWWASVRLATDSNDSNFNGNILTIKDGALNIAATVTFTTTNGQIAAKLYSYQSSTGTQENIGAIVGESTSIFIVIHCYTSEGDSFLDVYIDGSLQHQITRVGDSNTGAKQIGLGECSTSNALSQYRCYASEVILADSDIRGYRVKTLVPNADGAETDWSGTYADVDEAVPDANSITSTVLGDLQTFITAGLASSNMAIVAVCVNGIISGNGTSDVQAVIRKGGANYVSSDIGVTSGAVPYCTAFNDDPSTGSSWVAGDLTDIEFGFKSVA